jgi:hypothetical protein
MQATIWKRVFLLNEYAISVQKPLIYTGILGTYGMTLTCFPPEHPCLRCYIEEEPLQTGSCELQGVLGAIVHILASFAVTEALKFLLHEKKALRSELFYLDLWNNDSRLIRVPRRAECPTCVLRQQYYLNGLKENEVQVLCGKNQVKYWGKIPQQALAPLADTLSSYGTLQSSRFFLKFIPQENPLLEVTAYPDGCYIIKGTEDPLTAKKIVQRYFY